MEWLGAHSGLLTAVVTIISSLWAALHQADKSLKAHLATQFASKDDMARIEAKLDTMVSVCMLDMSARRRK